MLVPWAGQCHHHTKMQQPLPIWSWPVWIPKSASKRTPFTDVVSNLSTVSHLEIPIFPIVRDIITLTSLELSQSEREAPKRAFQLSAHFLPSLGQHKWRATEFSSDARSDFRPQCDPRDGSPTSICAASQRPIALLSPNWTRFCTFGIPSPCHLNEGLRAKTTQWCGKVAGA